MATIWGRLSMATSAAFKTFTRVWSDPQLMMARQNFSALQGTYDYRWHLYANSIYNDPTLWTRYRQQHGLYRYIRPIYNPVRRLVDFYAGIVYPGVLAQDAKRLPDGTPLAIPLAPDTSPQLRAAIGQLWQWSNWQTGKNLYVRYGAALGDVGIEILDEVDRGKVTFDILWPGLIADLELDTSGNVKRYALEYDSEDEQGDAYTYRKEVDGEWITEYKDDEPFQYDENIPANRPNPYGFAPMVWCKHSDVGGLHGLPAIRNVGKVDELNELASHAHDRVHAVLNSPILLSGDSVASLTDKALEAKRPASEDITTSNSGRESVKVFRATNGSMSTVELPQGEAVEYMVKLMEEIESDHPELTMYEQLRSMSQVTGPAAERLIGDAGAYIHEARANYDQQTIKLFQMAVAIAGWRAQTGAWGRELSRQQQAFISFDLDSYNAGALDFEILARPIVPNISKTSDEQRVLMEAGERGFMPRAKVVEALGGDPETDIALIDQEQATQQQANAATVQGVLERVRQGQAQGAIANE